MSRHRSKQSAAPALLTGTSSEYLGKRAIPRILRGRPVVLVLGPAGVGKTSVARRLAGKDHRYLNTAELHRALVEQVGNHGRWHRDLLESRMLVLDGVQWLTSRPGQLKAVVDLLQARIEGERRTILVQGETDHTLARVMDGLPAGSAVTLGLRFPVGRGKIRFAHRYCERQGIDRSAARGSDRLDPWTYERLFAYLASPPEDSSSSPPT